MANWCVVGNFFSSKIILLSTLAHIVQGGKDFCYDKNATCGPSKWSGQCNLPTSKRQSPIDLLPPASPNDIVPETLRFSPSYKQNYTGFDILNNGHTIQIKINKSEMGLLTVASIRKLVTYSLDQIHFHWGVNGMKGSEHSVNKQKHDMEAHFVHYNTNYGSVKEAVSSGDPFGLVVLGALYSKQPTASKQTFEGVRAGIQALAGSSCDGKTVRVKSNINFYNLLGIQNPDYAYTYSGSLTTPSCNEVVGWIVFEAKSGLQAADIEAFSNVGCSGKKVGNNFRPIQPLNNRNIEYIKIIQ